MNTDGLTTNATVRSGTRDDTFDGVLVVGILGGVGVIALVIGLVSRSIYKQTNGDGALRETTAVGRL